MRILNILQELFRTEGQDFVRGLYKQLLNRQPNTTEIMFYSDQLLQNIPKISILKNLLNSAEAIQLYQQPLGNGLNLKPTIADIIRTFFKADVNTLIRSAYLEVVGRVPRIIDVQQALLLNRGMMTPNTFITNLIESNINQQINPPGVSNLQVTSNPPRTPHPQAHPNPRPLTIHQSQMVQVHQHQHHHENVWENAIQGYYPYTWEWVSETHRYQNITPIYSSEILQLPQPKGLEHGIEWGKLLVKKEIPQPFVASIQLGRYWGSNGGVVIAPNNKILADVSQAGDVFQPNFEYRLFANNILPIPVFQQGNVAVLGDRYDHNYFHWIFDVASRLDLLQKSNIPIDNYLLDHSRPYQDELLTLLGIPKEKRIQKHPNLHLLAKNIISPSFTGASMGIMPKWACDFLRYELLIKRNVKKLPGYERIYISREDAHYRKLINEEDVMKVLEPYGFKRIVLGPLSAELKIQIFHSAEVVIGPHGAGLTNIVFCDPGTKIIDIYKPNWLIPAFWIISNHMGLDYYYLIGEGQRSSNYVEMKGITDNIFVNISQLHQVLQMASL